MDVLSFIMIIHLHSTWFTVHELKRCRANLARMDMLINYMHNKINSKSCSVYSQTTPSTHQAGHLGLAVVVIGSLFSA